MSTVNSETGIKSPSENKTDVICFFVTGKMYSDMKGMVPYWFLSVSEFVRHAVFYTARKFNGGKIQYRSFLDKDGVITRKNFFSREARFSRRVTCKLPPLLKDYIVSSSSGLLDVDLYNEWDNGVSLFLRGCINYYLEEGLPPECFSNV